MSKVQRVIKKIADSYWVWRNIKNLKPRILHGLYSQPLSSVQKKILNDLNRNGIAITHVDELLNDKGIYKELESFVKDFQDKKKNELEEARKHSDEVSIKKDFLYQFLGDKPELDPDDVNVKFALQEEILGIVNGYFGCLTKLKFYNIWLTFISQSGPRRSMLWHKDPEDKWILKVFLYLNDVDDGAGPFMYAPGTHRKGHVKQKPEWFKEPGRGAERSTDEQMAKVVPQQDWVKAAGRKGTLIFADTKGYHKGGFALKNERLMYNCLYVSPASKTQEVYTRKNGVDHVEGSFAKKYSLKPANKKNDL